jgi:hypothetical protein
VETTRERISQRQILKHCWRKTVHNTLQSLSSAVLQIDFSVADEIGAMPKTEPVGRIFLKEWGAEVLIF